MSKDLIDVIYDCETTGTDYKRNSIIQLSGIIQVNGETTDKFDFNVKPHPKAIITDEALEANGHKREDLDSYQPMDRVYKRLIAILQRYVDRFDKRDKMYLVGYNNRGFDDKFLRKFFELNQDPYFGSWFWADTIDVLVLASQYLRGRRRQNMLNFQLGTVAKELGIYVEADKFHNSMYDCEITEEVYKIVTGVEPERDDYDIL